MTATPIHDTKQLWRSEPAKAKMYTGSIPWVASRRVTSSDICIGSSRRTSGISTTRDRIRASVNRSRQETNVVARTIPFATKMCSAVSVTTSTAPPRSAVCCSRCTFRTLQMYNFEVNVQFPLGMSNVAKTGRRLCC